MDALLASVDVWQRVLVAYAVALGVEAPALLVVAYLRGRPWRERALALLPAVGNGVGMYLARSTRGALDAWESHAIFQFTHYPPTYWPNFVEPRRADLQALATSVQHQAWAMGALTLALLTGGWLLLLLWLPQPWRAERKAPTARKAAPAAPAVVDPQGSFELWYEPIEDDQG
jgi:hypothetical protein